ncbi:histidine phosphatase family protein [Candidatus Woesearchaeota archaeon]|nr:histidine phosphatase family protein [Candidatus Woesearchaeota archaeon]
MLHFLSKEKIDVLLKYPFFKDFLSGVTSKKVFLENLEEFKTTLSEGGVTESDLEILKATITINLKNKYFIMRHGESEANRRGIIVSSPAYGIVSFGLTNEGRRQVANSVFEKKKQRLLDNKTIIYSSDFARARETAEIAREILRAGLVILTAKLRERYFGNWDRTSNANYQKVWIDDANNPSHKNNGVESVMEVFERLRSLIIELEAKYAGKKILLVSHGDSLQILQTAFKGVDPSKHRYIRHLNLAEIRELKTK